jgi:hypothetical protein
MPPIALTDAQLAMITAAAKPLHACDRADFVDAVAARLRDRRDRRWRGRPHRGAGWRSFLPRAPQSRTVGGHPLRFFRLNAFSSTAA